jgi:hypothetical protein
MPRAAANASTLMRARLWSAPDLMSRSMASAVEASAVSRSVAKRAWVSLTRSSLCEKRLVKTPPQPRIACDLADYQRRVRSSLYTRHWKSKTCFCGTSCPVTMDACVYRKLKFGHNGHAVRQGSRGNGYFQLVELGARKAGHRCHRTDARRSLATAVFRAEDAPQIDWSGVIR